MRKPKIRHLAIFAREPVRLARYYETVFEMKLVYASDENCFVSDGYLSMAILKHRLDGSAPNGLNHFGFVVSHNQEIIQRIRDFGLETPKKRPADRPFAEYRACDPEGNFIDVSQHGYEEVKTERDCAGP